MSLMYVRIRPLELTGVRGRRSYRVDRIQGTTATDETFVAHYVGGNDDIFENGLENIYSKAKNRLHK